MKIKSIPALLCSILLVYVPIAQPSGAKAIGTLISDSLTQINGTAMPAGATIFAGDRIVSPEGASAALSLVGGSRLILTGPGTLQMKEGGSYPTGELEQGSVAVLSRASAPIVIEAVGTRTIGNKGDAVYAVTVNGNSLQVMASKGEASVKGADRTIEVSEGRTLDATMAPPNSADSQQGAQPAASGGYARFLTFERVVLIATAVASIAALAIAIKSLTRTCRTTASPSTVTCD